MSERSAEEKNVRERLIEEGVRELYAHGTQGFSLRRVAQNCGVPCAAPYRHFQDKQSLLEAVADAINMHWYERQSQALDACRQSGEEPLRIVCREYLRFLWDNPEFCVLATQRDTQTGKWLLNRLFGESPLTQQLIRDYILRHGISEQEAYERTYVLRSLLYGAAMLNVQNDMTMTAGVYSALCAAIDAQI